MENRFPNSLNKFNYFVKETFKHDGFKLYKNVEGVEKKLDLGNYHELDFSFSSCNILFDLISNLITWVVLLCIKMIILLIKLPVKRTCLWIYIENGLCECVAFWIFLFPITFRFNSQAFVFTFYTIIITISLYRFTSSLFSFLNVWRKYLNMV